MTLTKTHREVTLMTTRFDDLTQRLAAVNKALDESIQATEVDSFIAAPRSEREKLAEYLAEMYQLRGDIRKLTLKYA